MKDFTSDAGDVAADVLNVLRADRAGRQLAARLLAVAAEDGAADTAASDGPGNRTCGRVRRLDQSRYRPQDGRGSTADPTAAAGSQVAFNAVLDSMVRSGLKARLLHSGGVLTTADPDGLSQILQASRRFRRDTRLGSVFHHPKISFREVAATDSLHVVIDGNTVTSHIDRVSPLNLDPDHPAHYSPLRVLVHNATGIVDDVVRRLVGPS